MENVQTKNCVLNKEAISRKLRRMALEVAEQNAEEKEIIVAGIAGNGEIVAKCLLAELKKHSTVHTTLVTIHLNKKDPLEVSVEPGVVTKNKVVLVVDDVSNSGRTMLFALKPFLLSLPKKIQTLVLVERSHKIFPVQSDFVGLSISTTLQEHITVEVNGNDVIAAYLK